MDMEFFALFIRIIVYSGLRIKDSLVLLNVDKRKKFYVPNLTEMNWLDF